MRLEIPIEASGGGIDAYLDGVLADHPEIAYVAVTDEAHRVLSLVGNGGGAPHPGLACELSGDVRRCRRPTSDFTTSDSGFTLMHIR